MTIKQVCQRYGLTQDTLRYYEKIGVIPQVHRSASGIRDYDENDLGWVEMRFACGTQAFRWKASLNT